MDSGVRRFVHFQRCSSSPERLGSNDQQTAPSHRKPQAILMKIPHVTPCNLHQTQSVKLRSDCRRLPLMKQRIRLITSIKEIIMMLLNSLCVSRFIRAYLAFPISFHDFVWLGLKLDAENLWTSSNSMNYKLNFLSCTMSSHGLSYLPERILSLLIAFETDKPTKASTMKIFIILAELLVRSQLG